MNTDVDKALMELIMRLGTKVEALDGLRKRYEGREHGEHWNGMYHGVLDAQKVAVELRDELFKSKNL